MKSENPLKKILQERKWKSKQMAIQCDVAACVISNVCTGNTPTVPKKVLEGIKEMGYNPNTFISDFKDFRNEKREDLRK